MICQFCKIELSSTSNKFCNSSCSAQFNNRLRAGTRSIESRKRTSESVKRIRSIKPKPILSQTMECSWCKSCFLSIRKVGRKFKIFCSIQCSTNSKSQKCRDLALSRGFGGYNSKKINYQGIWFDSTWEVKIAEELDNNQISWSRPPQMKLSSGKHYTPDFYLPDYGVYLDPKAYVHDSRKEDTFSRIALFENDYQTRCLIISDEKLLTWVHIKSLLASSGGIEPPLSASQAKA